MSSHSNIFILWILLILLIATLISSYKSICFHNIFQYKNILYSNKVGYTNRDNNNDRKSSSSSSSTSKPSRPARGPSSHDTIRLARFARNLRDELTDIIARCDIKTINYPDDDLLLGTSIVDVEVSGDMSNAKVIISVLGNSVEKRQVFLWLSDNVGQVRYSLAKRMKFIKKVPNIVFKLMDPQTAEIMAIMEEEAMKREISLQNLASSSIEFDEDDDDDE